MVNWGRYDELEKYDDKYLPPNGQGDTMATQTVTAITKIVYKWYNDGDVYDNTGYLEGWWNDLSSYANWLYNRVGCVELLRIFETRTESEYEDLLWEVTNSLFDDERLESLSKKPAVGSIYDEEGPFSFVNRDEYDEEEDEDEYDW